MGDIFLAVGGLLQGALLQACFLHTSGGSAWCLPPATTCNGKTLPSASVWLMFSCL